MNLTEAGSPAQVKICGHRGASGYAPENTLAAFRRAGQLGATWLEFDVQLSADGVPVIFHDDTLERTTNLDRPLRPAQLTLAELKKLDAGSWFSPDFAGERIPTLDEVLEEFGPTMGLNLEIKSRPGVETGNGLEHKVADAVRRFGLCKTIIISSFDLPRLASLHHYAPELPLGALYTGRRRDYPAGFDLLAAAQSFEAIALHPPYGMVEAGLVGQTHAAGLLLNTWTVNNAADMQRLSALGVDMIITNYPDLFSRPEESGR